MKKRPFQEHFIYLKFDYLKFKYIQGIQGLSAGIISGDKRKRISLLTEQGKNTLFQSIIFLGYINYQGGCSLLLLTTEESLSRKSGHIVFL